MMEVGLYGKLPTHGDFLRRRVADDFVDAWDPWLQHCIAASRMALGEQWLETYLTSPVWRFALGSHVCGTAAVAGLIVPSVDRVGRYFPLTLVWQTPPELNSLEVAIRCRRGFERAERLLLDTLASEQFDFADFDRRVMELAESLVPANPDGAPRLAREWSQAALGPQARPRCIPLQTASALEAPAVQLLGWQLESSGAHGLWWTDGSALVEPSWLMAAGLPDSSSYAAMIDGAWAATSWDVAQVEADPSSTIVRAPTADELIVVTSAALTDRGPVRPTNQDAFLESTENGLWAVADGMGGLSDGEVASRMVCDSLTDIPVSADLDEAIEAVIRRLREVNSYLRRVATRLVNPVQSGSTAIVLLIRRRECAVLWAGDSRVYRLRDELLSQMTTDHSWQSGGEEITRAVGAEDALNLDVIRSDVRPSDRFLLCSDGIGRVLDNAALTQALQSGSLESCCAELVSRSIAEGGTDNLTAVIVDCAPASEDDTAVRIQDALL
jgi:type VI secretion system protein ImpM